MRAIILAAGRGSRVARLTEDRPKCLIEFCGKPLLTWQLEALRGGGISKIGIVTGYRPDKIQPDQVTLFNNPEWNQTNMVRSLLCARSWLEAEDSLVSYADIVYPPETVQKVMEQKSPIGLPYNTKWRQIWEMRFRDPLADVETFKFNDRSELTEIGNRPGSLDEVEGQYMGLLRFTPNGWKQIAAILETLPPEATKKMDMTTLLRHCLKSGVPVSVFPIDGKWYEVDSEEDLESYKPHITRNHGFPW